MKVSELLRRLNGVKRIGSGRWMAKCPAHADRSPSLSIKELDDKRILLHCFAGCDVSAVVGAIGLELSDLFPDRPAHAPGHKPELGAWHVLDIFKALLDEVLVVQLAAAMLARGEILTTEDQMRLLQSSRRIYDAVTYIRGAKHG